MKRNNPHWHTLLCTTLLPLFFSYLSAQTNDLTKIKNHKVHEVKRPSHISFYRDPQSSPYNTDIRLEIHTRHHAGRESEILIKMIVTPKKDYKLIPDEDKHFRFELQNAEMIETSGKPVIENRDDKEIILLLKSRTTTRKNIKGVISLRYQLCNNFVCLAPETRSFAFKGDTQEPGHMKIKDLSPNLYPQKKSSQVSDLPLPSGTLGEILKHYRIAALSHGYRSSASFLKFLKLNSSPPLPATLAALLAAVLFGGIALNLTPCVLPMIPVNLTIISRYVSQSKGASKGFQSGLIFGAGMTIAYGSLGLISTVFQTTFGTLQSKPLFHFAVAAVFLVLIPAVLGYINIDFSGLRGKISFSKQTGSGPDSATSKTSPVRSLLTLFIMGVFSALLAGACVAPVVISVLVLSSSLTAAGHKTAYMLPFLLGLGMALPWPFAAAGIKILPKPGKWMNHVKYIFAAFILAMAMYYIYSGIKTVQLRKKTADLTMEETDHLQPDIHLPYSKQINDNLAEYLGAVYGSRKNVLIDFKASWCKNCKAMERQISSDPAIRNIIKSNFYFITYQAEDPDDPVVKAFLKWGGIQGLPAYLILTNIP